MAQPSNFGETLLEIPQLSTRHDLLFTYSKTIEQEFDLHHFKGLYLCYDGGLYLVDLTNLGLALHCKEQSAFN